MDFNFRGKTALITGGTRGIGKSIAELMTWYGASVVITGTSEKTSKNKKYKYMSVDFNDALDTRHFLQKLDMMGPIDICINNAGINKIDPICNVQDEDWSNILNVNLFAPMKIIRQLAPKMIKNKYGRIVNISSMFGTHTLPFRASYSSSKFGLNGLTKSVAVELAHHNILVNSVCPGVVNTELTRSVLNKKQIKEMQNKIPIGRLATPDEIATLVVFLASDLNTYIVGQDILIDGGYTVV